MSTQIDFTDLMSHRAAWRQALELAIESAEVRAPDIDDKAYWTHELKVFDRTVGILDRVAVVDPALSHEINLERFSDIVSDKKAFILSAGLSRDAMFTMPIFTNAECVYDLLSDFDDAVSDGGLMEYIRRGHATSGMGSPGISAARIVENIAFSFSHVDEETSTLLVGMISDACFHAPHMDVYSASKKDDIEAKVFSRWQEKFEDNRERVASFMLACIEGIDPECNLLEGVSVRPHNESVAGVPSPA
ncbi:hypothetical protein G6L37_03910 [Agrobacterium rubi]|nr:hypothetical protein [Agrobacterium rubi]NTF24495.1 hypothetical protein [Agrobacterium rubi]